MRGERRETRRERASERRGHGLPDVTVRDTGSSKHRHAACNSRRRGGDDDDDDERCFPRSLASARFPPLSGL